MTRRLCIAATIAGLLAALPPESSADQRQCRLAEARWKARRVSAGTRGSCYRMLAKLGVRFRRVKGTRIRMPVRVLGPIGGVRYQGYDRRPLILDCSLVVSLALSGPILRAQGITRARYSLSYDRVLRRFSWGYSPHSYGLALDVHGFSGPDIGDLSVETHYEQGLGNDDDCVGAPMSKKGAALRTLDCEMSRSGWFGMVLNPDYNAQHLNHFHFEARPWHKRRDRLPAVAKRRRRGR